MKCPVCGNERKSKSYCEQCGWDFTGTVTEYGTLFSEIGWQEYCERLRLSQAVYQKSILGSGDETRITARRNPSGDPALYAKNEQAARMVWDTVIYAKLPNNSLADMFELRKNGDLICYGIVSAEKVSTGCKAVSMIYSNHPFLVYVRKNGQLGFVDGYKEELRHAMEQVKFKVLDVASNYYGTFFLNAAGGVVGINNNPIRGQYSFDYFKNLPESGVCKIIARDSELLMLHLDGTISNYSMRDCGFLSRGHYLQNLDRISDVNWSNTEIVYSGTLGKDWILCDRAVPSKVLETSSNALAELLKEEKQEEIKQILLTDNSIIIVKNDGKIDKKAVANYPNVENSIWVQEHPQTYIYNYDRLDGTVEHLYYSNGYLLPKTEKSIYVDEGVWGPKRFAYLLGPKERYVLYSEQKKK